MPLESTAVRQAEIALFERGKPIRPTTDEELLTTIELLFGTKFPTQSVCPGHTAPGVALCDAYFAKHDFQVWFASRGLGGKSVTLGTLTLMELLAGMDVVTLGGSSQQSERVLEVMAKGWDHKAMYDWDGQTIELSAPRWAVQKSNSEKTVAIWGNKAIALGASETSVRGEHPQRLNLDEVDAMDMGIYNSAQGMPMNGRGFQMATVASSTRQNLGGTMDYVMDWASDNNYPIYEWCYKENMVSNGGFITEEALTKKKASVPAHIWIIEYENQEPAGREKLFAKEILDAYFMKGIPCVDALGIGWPTCEDEIGMYYEFEEPDPDGSYVTAVDWARERDYTVIATWRTDYEKPTIVAWERVNKQPFPIMAQKLNNRWLRYGGIAIHDATSIGQVIMDLIEIPDRQIIHEIIGAANRMTMIRDYVTMVEQGDIQVPFIRSMYKEHRSSTVDVYKSGQGKEHAPDTLISAALAMAVVKGTAQGNKKKTKRPGRFLRPRSW